MSGTDRGYAATRCRNLIADFDTNESIHSFSGSLFLSLSVSVSVSQSRGLSRSLSRSRLPLNLARALFAGPDVQVARETERGCVWCRREIEDGPRRLDHRTVCSGWELHPGTPRTPIQETAFSAQCVPGMGFLVVDFGVPWI
eukprot:799025-Rhodomonas_salina.3